VTKVKESLRSVYSRSQITFNFDVCLLVMFVELTEKHFLCKFSISPGCIIKIPLNPPLQKVEVAGMPGLIEKLQFIPLDGKNEK